MNLIILAALILLLIIIAVWQIIINHRIKKLLKEAMLTLIDTLDIAEKLAKLNDVLIKQIEEDWEIMKELTKPCCKNKKKKCSK